MKLFIAVAAAVVSAAAILSSSAWAAEVAAKHQHPRTLLVKIHADWCASCAALNPRLHRLQKDIRELNSLLITLDFTGEASTGQANQLASVIGIDAIVEEHNSTGLLLVIDAKSKVLIGRLSRSNSDQELLAALRQE